MRRKIPDDRIPGTPRAKRAWIKLQLAMRGTSLSQLSREHPYSFGCLRQAMCRRKPRAEQIIASALGRSPDEIWPERYEAKKPPRGQK